MPRVIDQFNIPFWTAVWGRPFKKCEIVEKLIKFFFFGRKIWFVKLWEINSIFETANYCMVSLWKIIIECLAITLKKKFFFFFKHTHIYRERGWDKEIHSHVYTKTACGSFGLSKVPRSNLQSRILPLNLNINRWPPRLLNCAGFANFWKILASFFQHLLSFGVTMSQPWLLPLIPFSTPKRSILK